MTTFARQSDQLSTWLQRMKEDGPQLLPTSREELNCMRSRLMPVELPGSAGLAWWPGKVAICGYGANLESRMECFNDFVVHHLWRELGVDERRKGRHKGFGAASGLDSHVMKDILGHSNCFATFLKVLSCPSPIVRSFGCIGNSYMNMTWLHRNVGIVRCGENDDISGYGAIVAIIARLPSCCSSLHGYDAGAFRST